MKYNLLREPYFDTDIGRVTLPGMIRGLYAGEIREISALQAHHKMPVFTYLCQITAMVNSKFHADLSDEASILEGLIDLSGGREEMWCMITADDQKGFMQMPFGKLKFMKKKYYAPEHIDLILVTKEHSTKSNRAGANDIQSWAFALISAQTNSVYSANGVYGTIKRANTYATRPFMGLMPIEGADDLTTHFGRWLKQDVDGLLRQRRSNDPSKIARFKKPGLAQVYDWDGSKEAVSLQDLDPHFVDTSRIIKMGADEHGLYVRQAGTKGTMVGVAAKVTSSDADDFTDELSALVSDDIFEADEEEDLPCDPWTPITLKEDRSGKARRRIFNLGDRRLDYRMILEFFSASHELPSLMRDSMDDLETKAFYVDFMGRGQGISVGRHSRILHLPKDVLANIWQRTESEHVKEMVKSVSFCEMVARKTGLLFLAHGDDKKYRNPDFRERVKPQIRHLLDSINRDIDLIFFQHLTAISRAGGKEAEQEKIKAFKQDLKDITNRHCFRFTSSRPVSSEARVKADGVATDYLYHNLNRFLPEAHVPGSHSEELTRTAKELCATIAKLPKEMRKSLSMMSSGEPLDIVYKWSRMYPETVGKDIKTWCEIIKTYAGLTGFSERPRSIHSPKVPLGRFLATNGREDLRPRYPVTSEGRFSKLMRAPRHRRARMLRAALIRSRIPTGIRGKVDARDIAWFLLDDGRGHSRQRISKNYFYSVYLMALRNNPEKAA